MVSALILKDAVSTGSSTTKKATSPNDNAEEMHDNESSIPSSSDLEETQPDDSKEKNPEVISMQYTTFYYLLPNIHTPVLLTKDTCFSTFGGNTTGWFQREKS